MLCKEFDLANIDKDWIKLVRKSNNDDNNLHLYIHQPGMFFMQEFKLKYPSSLFKKSVSEKNKVLFESYDILNDPQFPCSSEIHQECVNREIIKIFNSTFGCTFPIQRYNSKKYSKSLCLATQMALKQISLRYFFYLVWWKLIVVVFDIFFLRELFGVEVCRSNELETLKNITKMVINNEVCKIPCNLHYIQLHNLPGCYLSIK